MKKILYALVAVLVSCTSPVATGSAHTAIVVNSLWQVVKTVPYTSSRAVDTDVLTEVALYNATHTDDQQFVYEDVAPAIEDSPLADVFIVNAKTHEVYLEYSDNYADKIDGTHGPKQLRTWLVENKAGWALEAQMLGGVLYIDRIPDLVPEAPDLRSLDEKYIIYALDSTGHIVYTTHCYDPDVPDHDTEAEAQTLMNYVRPGYNMDGLHSIEGHYYIDPTI